MKAIILLLQSLESCQSMYNLLSFIAIISLVSETWTYHYMVSRHNNEYYMELTDKENWYDALKDCTRYGLSLLTVDSAEKQNEIVTMLKDNFSQEKYSRFRLWLAASDNAVHGVHTWQTTGHTLRYSNWEHGEPNNAGGKEHCIELGNNDFLWNDVECNFAKNYICEKTPMTKTEEEEIRCQNKLNEMKRSHDQSISHKMFEIENLKKSQKIDLNYLQSNHKQQMDAKDQELYEIKKTHEQNMTNKKYEMESLKESLKNELNNLQKDHKQEMDAKDQKYENLKNSHSDEIKKLLQSNQHELEATKKVHANIVEYKEKELKALQKSHENATNDNLKLLEEINALQTALAFRDGDILTCQNKTEQRILELMKQKNTEFEELKETLKNDVALEMEGLKKTHANDMNLVRLEKDQNVEDFRNACEAQIQNLTETKNREIESLKNMYKLQSNRAISFKFYNFVFRGNNNCN